MESALVDQTSAPFLGQWKRLVSTTNWDKGQIICQWREAMRASGAPAAEFSDEAWSRRVGNVTPQHVGRLRRAYERFGPVREDYLGLYWSHFQAALDWDDAEMWLEGAVQSDWSVADMRAERAKVTGELIAANEPLAEVAAPWDDDAEPEEPADASGGSPTAASRAIGERDGMVSETSQADLDQADSDQFDEEYGDEIDGEGGELDCDASVRPDPVRPFANLPPLPADVSDAFDAYKLCILRHKLAGWQEISCDELLSSLDALRQLALAPGEGF